MVYNFDNIPGYCSPDEAEIIYNLTSKIDSIDILEVGCFTGRLTVGLATRFPNHKIKAIDEWGYVDRLFEDQPDHILSINTFKHYTNGYQNISVSKCNLFNYHEQHDIVILSLDGYLLDWGKVLDHAQKLAVKCIIGRHNHQNEKRKNLHIAASNHMGQFHGHGVYSIIKGSCNV